MPEMHRDFLLHLLPVCENTESHCYNAYTDWSLQYAPAKSLPHERSAHLLSTDSAGTSDFLFDKTTHPSSLPENSSETAGSHLQCFFRYLLLFRLLLLYSVLFLFWLSLFVLSDRNGHPQLGKSRAEQEAADAPDSLFHASLGKVFSIFDAEGIYSSIVRL